MPDCRWVTYSLRELSYLRKDALAPQDSHDSYLAVAKELGYDALGKPENDEAFEKILSPLLAVNRCYLC